MTQNYARRCNADGSFDSICLHCFQTVASATSNAALAENEMQHWLHWSKSPNLAPPAAHAIAKLDLAIENRPLGSLPRPKKAPALAHAGGRRSCWATPARLEPSRTVIVACTLSVSVKPEATDGVLVIGARVVLPSVAD